MDLPELRTEKSSRRLEQVAALRSRGVGEHIDLPQIVVCGDQSAGKSSVLEGISGIPFPRQDGICTKFATEIILEHSEEPMAILATILPCRDRKGKIEQDLRAFNRQLKRFDDLPEAIAAAGDLMGVQGYGTHTTGPAFSADVLRIKVSGPTGLHLTVVDLPGLISSANEEQNDNDVDLVHALVDTYAMNPRTIILAVVQAGNDIANQPIIRKSRKFDPHGQRTVGIITKPDLINTGTEARIALLARNEDTTKLNLGFFLLKNPSPTELGMGMTSEERQQLELRFFGSKAWKNQSLDPTRVGILALRAYLQDLLDRHVERELPKVRQELQSFLQGKENELAGLGDERTTTAHMRMHLSRMAMKFHGLVVAGLHGNYHGGFFVHEAAKPSIRLRALVHRLNTSFASTMRQRGMKRALNARSKVITETNGVQEHEIAQDPSNAKGPTKVSETVESPEEFISDADVENWIREVYLNTRGLELPGNHNHVLLADLFHEQSSKWYSIAEGHLKDVQTHIVDFVALAMHYTTSDERVLNETLGEIRTRLRRNYEAASCELDRLWQDELSQPLTYNHYYTDNVQKSRHDGWQNDIKAAIAGATEDKQVWNGKAVSNVGCIDREALLKTLQQRVIVDMDKQACTEALAELSAYYKVAQKSFVDNVCKQVVERHLLRELPAVFSPEAVSAYSDDLLHRLAAETPGQVEKRKSLLVLLEALRSSLDDLR